MMYLLAALGGAVTVLAFPPFGWWPLAIVGPALWLTAFESDTPTRRGAVSGFVFGLAFYSGLIWWIGKLGIEAVIPLVLVQALFWALFGGLLVRLGRRLTPLWWWVVAAGLWALVEAIRYRLPVGGLEWGALGYALADVWPARTAARWIGTSGWTVLVMAAAAGLASVRRGVEWMPAALPMALIAVFVGLGATAPSLPTGRVIDVAVVQGSTPCPFVHCPDERYGTYLQHLDLTKSLRPGLELVVWSEGSTGSTNADPVNNPEVGAAIGAEAARLGAWFLVGGDRPVDDERWINANVVFDPNGNIVGEYRKRHPVPFGEYIPARPFFEWIPALSQVPRDMIPGDAPVVFDLGIYDLGSVISFEGGFSRYARQTAAAGADLLVVATNEGSYGFTPASDQFIGMTRMRSAETGLDVVHAAVTGKSVLITDGGRLGEETGLGTSEVLSGRSRVRPDLQTLYVRWGDWLMALALASAVVVMASASMVNDSEADQPIGAKSP